MSDERKKKHLKELEEKKKKLEEYKKSRLPSGAAATVTSTALVKLNLFL